MSYINNNNLTITRQSIIYGLFMGIRGKGKSFCIFLFFSNIHLCVCSFVYNADIYSIYK